jgi:hypothetical protein
LYSGRLRESVGVSLPQSMIDHVTALIYPTEALSARAFCHVSSHYTTPRCREDAGGVQQPVEAREIDKQKLHPQQEHELVEYINRLTEKALPPAREMTRRFAAEIAHKHVGAWASHREGSEAFSGQS